MDKQAVKKVMTVCFLSAAALTWVVVEVLFRAFAGAIGFVQKLHSNNLISHGLPLVSALAVFVVLQFSPKIIVWAEEVILEISKVVWPSRKDTVGMTIVVVIMVLIASCVLFIFDNLARFSLEFLDKLLV